MLNKSAAPLKIKDPKRVEAGKKLAEYNRTARQKQNQQKNEEIISEDPSSWIPNINLTSVIGIVSLGLTAGDLFLRYRAAAENKREQKSREVRFRESIDSDQLINSEERKFGME